MKPLMWVSLRHTVVTVIAIICFTEFAGIGHQRMEHLGAYFGAVGIAYVLHLLDLFSFGTRP